MRWTLAILILAVAAASVEANFAAAPGFSGRVADCSFCHVPIAIDNAQVHVDGVPEEWTPGASYDITVSVTGGPPSNPAGPQAGFEIETLTGTFAPAPDATGVRSFHDRQATYTEQGVFQREWQVRWTAPDLSAMPMQVQWWVAGMAANGNHNVETNTSAVGEFGDSIDNATFLIPPSETAWEAWRAIPLQPPVVDEVQATATGHQLRGHMPDANATILEIWDGARWQQRDVATQWRLNVAGDDAVQLRAAGSQRVSPALTVDLATGTIANATQAPVEDTPIPLWSLALPLTVIALLRRHP